MIDAILYNKALKAETYGIDMQIQALIPDALSIADLDIISVFANLIDNAIEANEALETENRFITITTGMKHNHLFLKVENTKSSSVIVDGKTGRTTKKKDKEDHGVGMKIVQKTIEKYNGMWNIEDKGDVVKITVYMEMPDK